MNHEEQNHGHHTTVNANTEHSSEGNPLLRLDPGMAIWTWIVFFILLFLLGKFAWRPILKSLDEREEKIKKSLDDADKATLALEEATERQNRIIEKAEKEAMAIVGKSREVAQNVASEIEEKSKVEAQRMVESAKNAISAEKEQAIAELRKDAAEIVIQASSKLIAKNLDDEKNRELVNGYINEVVG